jgi:hypothetical protein
MNGYKSMLTELQSDALNLINQRPRKASELGSILGIDRRQAGRLGDRLAELGHATRQNNGEGFVYFGRGNQPEIHPLSGHVRPEVAGQEGPVDAKVGLRGSDVTTVLLDDDTLSGLREIMATSGKTLSRVVCEILLDAMNAETASMQSDLLRKRA